MDAWAKRIGVAPREIHIRPMTRRWGAARRTGG
ncbi:MAG: M48 family metallopeptidase [Gemmatimonadota bacterium]|nr:M48 family metallopeptidase [Gemmatimonadota bacterium]